MTDRARDEAFVLLYDRETQIHARVELAVGDTLEVVRGNGPREGMRAGTATITESEDGSRSLSVMLDGSDVRLRLEGGQVVVEDDDAS